jgi:hypothetical protein
MNRKTIIILGCCLLFASVLVITLYAASHKIVHKHNSFLREYKKFAAVKSNEMDIGFNSWYIAGITADHVYLGNVTAPFRLLLMNSTLTDSQHVKLHIRNMKNPIVYKSTTIKIAPPYFYIADGLKPALFRGMIGDWQAESLTYDSGVHFTRLVPISKTSFAIRTNEAQTFANILGKVQSDTPYIQLKHGLLQKQVDGIFCTDGMLLYNDDLKRLIYTYYYRNEYIVCDTNMNLDYRGHTIDTFSRAQIKVGHINSENSNTLLDRKFVNIRSCTYGNYLFIRSNLLAKHDPKNWLSTQSVIDVYDLKSNTYRFSFILPNHGKARVKDFMVLNNKTLIALFDHYIIKYDLQQSYFK